MVYAVKISFLLGFRESVPEVSARLKEPNTKDRRHVAWQLNRNIPEIRSPLFYQDRIYMVRNGGILTSVNATAVKIIYDQRLKGTGQYCASPLGANGHLYLVSNRGVVSVVKAGDAFELVHQHNLGEPAFVTPAFDPTTISIRTQTKLCAFQTGGRAGSRLRQATSKPLS